MVIFWEHNQSLSSFAAKLSFKTGRKMLQKEGREEPKGPKSHDGGQNIHHRGKNDPESLSTTKKVGAAATGVIFLSCALLCPCFYRKRKATEHAVLSKDPNSSESSYTNLVKYHNDKILSIYHFGYAS